MSLVTDLPAIFDQFSEARQKGFLTVMDLKERGIPLVGGCIGLILYLLSQLPALFPLGNF